MNIFQTLFKKWSVSETARACEVDYHAAKRWRDQNRLPRTELTGETQYAKAIESMTGGRLSVDAMHRQTRKVLNGK